MYYRVKDTGISVVYEPDNAWPTVEWVFFAGGRRKVCVVLLTWII